MTLRNTLVSLSGALGGVNNAWDLLGATQLPAKRKNTDLQCTGFERLEERALMAVLHGAPSGSYVDHIVGLPGPAIPGAAGQFGSLDVPNGMYVDQIVGLPSPAIPVSGLVGSWSFDSVSGSMVADVSGSRHEGGVNGATWASSGRVGGALSFDGVNDLVDTGAWDVSSNALTIATWFRAEDFNNPEGRLISKATGVQEQEHWWMLSTIESDGTKLRFRLKAGGTTKTLVANQGNLIAGEWMHAAAVYDGSMMRIFLNGVEVGATPHSGSVSTNANAKVVIGNNPDGSRPFDGEIDQMQIYDKALSPEEISALISGAPVANQGPDVEAGPNRGAVVDVDLALDGTVTDDGLPNSTALTTSWSKVSGPGNVTFADASSVDTTARFSQTGSYVLRLDVSDGELSGSDTVTIEVTDDAQLEYYKSVFDQTYNQYKSSYDGIAASGLGVNYYTFQYVFGGTLSMFEATQDATYLQRALTWAETMVSKATIVDVHGNLNWAGNWASSHASQNIAYQLDDYQGSTELARLARIIITDPALNASYGTRATAIYNFVRDNMVDKNLWDRSALSWHLYNASDQSGPYSDKNSLLVSTMTDLKMANDVLGTNDRVKNDYQGIINQLAGGFKARLVPAATAANCHAFGQNTNALVYDCGVHNWQLPDHANDTSHANREPSMAVTLLEAGMVMEQSDVNGLALLINDVIWNGSMTSPQFTNHIDGNNDPNLGQGPYGLGIVYSGWVKLAQYNSESLAIFDATLRAIENGVSNPSLNVMDNLHGRAALAGHLAKAVAQPVANLEAAGGVAAASDSAKLTQDQLQPIVDFAISQFATTHWNESQINFLNQVEFEIADLGAALLGQATQHKVLIDADAAGHGWFVDSTPAEDEEFYRNDENGSLNAKEGSSASGHFDLLTVVMHELGHMLGHDHSPEANAELLMNEMLSAGVRKEFDPHLFDQVFSEK